MQQGFYGTLRKVISDDRLNSYRCSQSDSEIDLIALYTWNIALCESLYPLLNNFEVALRNHLNDSFSLIYNSDWLTDPTILESESRKKVLRAQSDLQRKHKPTVGGHLIAELSLGFWTSLSYSKYEQKFWRKLLSRQYDTYFIPNLMPRRNRTRNHVSEKLRKIHQLRNRIFHHESILKQDLNILHNEIIEAISWIDTSLSMKTNLLDRFEEVFLENQGFNIYRSKIQSLDSRKL
jgi:hypothetical protein